MKRKFAERETKPYICRFIPELITVDGELDKPAWQKAPVLDFLLPVTGATPKNKTEGRILWDSNYLHVGFKAYDKDIWGYYVERDAPIYNEDVLEVFFKTDPKEEPYFDFEINPLGTVYDSFIIKGWLVDRITTGGTAGTAKV